MGGWTSSLFLLSVWSLTFTVHWRWERKGHGLQSGPPTPPPPPPSPTPSVSIRRSISVRFCGIFRSRCSSDRKNNPNTSTSASAPCKNIVRAGRCTVRSPALCADTHTHTHTHTQAVIGRISGKGNLRQARAIWGDDKILWGAEESVAAGENDL